MKSILLFFLVIPSIVYSQVFNTFECEAPVPLSGDIPASGNPNPGFRKPARTGSNFFPVLVVFVQFKNEAPAPDWPTNAAPTYLNDLISKVYKTPVNGEWWNTYNEQQEILSDQMLEMSRGYLNMISPDEDAFSVVLPKTAQEYWDDNSGSRIHAEREINADIWQSIKSQGLVDWRKYDRWEKVGNSYFFRPLGNSDGYVDMIYKVHKSPGSVQRTNGSYTTVMFDATGYAYLSVYNRLGYEVTVDAHGTKVQYGYGVKGSGLSLTYSGTLQGYVGGLGHEHMHYLLTDGHNVYSRVSFGVGFDAFLSPFDWVAMDYAEDDVFSFTSTDYSLGDYSSRNGNIKANILRIPIQGNQFFVLANRNKVSKWDRPMTGDTAQLDPYAINNDYGKGLYIYHTNDAYNISNNRDMECADGYWNWVYSGTTYRVIAHDCWNSGNVWKYYKKNQPLYTNDPSTLGNTNLYGDGASFHYSPTGAQRGALNKWWGIGKKETNHCSLGTDRLWVNEKEIHSSLENQGDRYDSWAPGFNEIFSRYSSPSTVKWDNSDSKILIWYKEEDHGNAELKIYKVGENGFTTENDILAVTPPSRPMGIKEEACVFSNGEFRPKISWVHNMEPDMARGGTFEPPYKRYKIYRSVANNMNEVPPDAYRYPENVYTNIATVDIPSGTTPTFTDNSVISGCYLPDGQCPPDCWIIYPIRYRVVAVDKHNDASVASDFVSTTGIKTQSGGSGGKDGDNIFGTTSVNEVPKEFALKQNYPNPFNPSTNIQFDLPKEGFVTLKIYDATGREVMELVNEFKPAGSYIAAFNGSQFSSGIYYYTVKADNFKETRKMVLLK